MKKKLAGWKSWPLLSLRFHLCRHSPFLSRWSRKTNMVQDMFLHRTHVWRCQIQSSGIKTVVNECRLLQCTGDVWATRGGSLQKCTLQNPAGGSIVIREDGRVRGESLPKRGEGSFKKWGKIHSLKERQFTWLNSVKSISNGADMHGGMVSGKGKERR